MPNSSDIVVDSHQVEIQRMSFFTGGIALARLTQVKDHDGMQERYCIYDARNNDRRNDVPARRRTGRRFAICFCHRGKVRFTQERSFGWVPFAEPALCIKAVGGPFEFTIDIVPMQEGDAHPVGRVKEQP
jgi:hypothetical protein